ncbi:phage tail tube protein [Paenibacillus sinopodophylli]|uniref:phage tail tube protein n=1 Tax=Paenibacillus sinopodophylli TaxID=1837342 RepID=UPI00110CD012|nr:phage tail tube protein [Paenibacillus sinopodophylli]
MSFMNPVDTISGKQAKAFATITGRVEELFYAKSLESTIEKNKSDVPVLGKTNTGKKAAGWSGSGTLTVYYMTSVFRDLMLTYVKTGRDFYFDIQVENDDPSSSVGKQTIILKNCNLDSIIAAKFDITSDDSLEEELAFTFDDYDILGRFNAPAQ